MAETAKHHWCWMGGNGLVPVCWSKTTQLISIAGFKITSECYTKSIFDVKVKCTNRRALWHSIFKCCTTWLFINAMCRNITSTHPILIACCLIPVIRILSPLSVGLVDVLEFACWEKRSVISCSWENPWIACRLPEKSVRLAWVTDHKTSLGEREANEGSPWGEVGGPKAFNYLTTLWEVVFK